jgi:hypothetical protein
MVLELALVAPLQDGALALALQNEAVCRHWVNTLAGTFERSPILSMTVDTAIACPISILAPSGGHSHLSALQLRKPHWQADVG